MECNPLHGVTAGVALENSPDCWCLVRMDLQANALDRWPAVAIKFSRALNWHVPISEHAAASVQSAQRELLDSAESLFAEVDAVLLVDSAVDCREHPGALRIAVESLSDEADFYAGEFQPFDDAVAISQISAQPACVIDKDHIEWPRLSLRGCEKFLQTGALGSRSGDRPVREDALIENAQPGAVRVFAALPDLLVDGKSVLLFRTEARVDRAACWLAHRRGLLRVTGFLRCECAAQDGVGASLFSCSVSARYCSTSAGTIARSMNAFNSGVSGDGRRRSMLTSFGAVATFYSEPDSLLDLQLSRAMRVLPCTL